MSVRLGLIDLVQARGRRERVSTRPVLHRARSRDDRGHRPHPARQRADASAASAGERRAHRDAEAGAADRRSPAARRPARRLGSRHARSAPRRARAPVERARLRGAPLAWRALRVPPRYAAGARGERAARAARRVGRHGGLPPRRRMARRRGGPRQLRVGAPGRPRRDRRCRRGAACPSTSSGCSRWSTATARCARSSSRATCRASTRARCSSRCSRRASCGAARRDANGRTAAFQLARQPARSPRRRAPSGRRRPLLHPRLRRAARRPAAARDVGSRRAARALGVTLYEGIIVPVIAIGSARREMVVCQHAGRTRRPRREGTSCRAAPSTSSAGRADRVMHEGQPAQLIDLTAIYGRVLASARPGRWAR